MSWTTVPCPIDGTDLSIEITFTGEYPTLNLNCPDLVAHMKEKHGDL